MEISRRTHTILFIDTSPSELIHKLSDKIIVQTLINYFEVDYNRIQLQQFKNTRTSKRKLETQKRIIEGFENGIIRGCGCVTWNSQRLAMQNACKFVVDAQYLSPEQLILGERITISGEEVSIGHFLSLSWYAISIATNFNYAAILAKFENKHNAMMLLDLLPGDSIESSRNLTIVKHIIRNTILNDMFEDAVKHNKINLAFGYAARNGSTSDLKREAPLCLSDWITYSFYAKLRREKIISDDKYESLAPFTELADYLVEKGFFKVAPPFKFTDDNLPFAPYNQ